jgi:outer membrane protein TolC
MKNIIRLLFTFAWMLLSIQVFAEEVAPQGGTKKEAPVQAAAPAVAPTGTSTAAEGATPATSVSPNIAQQNGPPPTQTRIITLGEAQEMAINSSYDAMYLREKVYQADIAVKQAWSILLPNLSAQGSVTRNKEEVSIAFPTGVPEQPTIDMTIQDLWAKSVGFAANIALLNPQSIPIIKLAKDATEKERLSSQIARNEILFAVTALYYQAYASKDLVSVNRENLATAEEFLRHATYLKEGGQGTKIDTNRGELQVLQAKQTLDDSLDTQHRLMVALKYMIQTDEDFDIVGPGDVVPLDKSLSDLQSDALDKRIELKEAAVQRRMADRMRMQTITQFLPVLDVTYQWSWASATGFTGSNVNWMLIFGAKWLLFQGGYHIWEYKKNQSQTRMADINIEKIKLDLKQEVENKYIDVEQQRRNVEYADQQESLSEINQDLISKQFEAGIITSLDVAAATSTLATAKQLRVYKRLLFDLAVLTLRKSAGEYNTLAFKEQ